MGVLRFILGRAGTGKTTRCLAEIGAAAAADPFGPAIVLLVPEQATFQTELALLRHCPGGGAFRAQVLSFRRLAYRVLLEAGGALRPHIADTGKQMVLRALTGRRRDQLRIFRRMAGQGGFGQRLAGVLSELKAYRVAPRDLRAAAGRLAGEDLLRAKLDDLALLYDDLEEYLAGRYTDPDDYLGLLAQRLPLARSLAGAEFWLDAFAGFTPAEFLVLEAVLEAASRVTVTLCLDPGGGEEDLFARGRETRDFLEGLARARGHVLEPPLSLSGTPPRLAGFPACAFLERHFFRRPAPVWRDAPSGISLYAATDRRAEVEAAAREMVRLARERHLRFRDMLVLVRDLDPYRDLVATVFTDYGIPFFIDYKRPVTGHPLVELIRGALDCALENWSYQAVFRYLKTDLVDVDRQTVDELENYVLAHGIRGERWHAPWGGAPETVEAARAHVAGPLAALHRQLDLAATVRERTANLYGFLAGLGVPARLAAWEEAAASAGELAVAAEHAQVWPAVVELCDQMVEALGGEEMSLADYASVLAEGLAALRLALVPPGLDQVLVASLDRSRHPEVRAAFLLGVNEGVLPARPPADGFFTDAERARLLDAGVVLAPGARRLLLDEEYLVYVALTRASERLYVSYAMTGEDGAVAAPSLVVRRLRELLPALDPDPERAVTRPAPAVSQLALQLRQAKTGGVLDDFWRAVHNWALAHPVWGPRLAVVREALDYQNRERPLPRAVRGALFPRPLVTGVSRLEQFRACPFAHFLSYGLRLAERPVRRLAPPDVGQFFHRVLHRAGQHLLETSRSWGDLDEFERADLVRRVTADLVPGLQNEILLSTARYRALSAKLGRLVERSARALAEHDRRGCFRPLALEAAFGHGEKWPPLVLDGGTVELQGRIDRVDWARDAGGRVYVRVIDYKSGAEGLPLSEVYQGLRLQLMVYLDVALQQAGKNAGGPVLPGGAFYFQVQDPLVTVESPPGPDEAARLVLHAFKLRGLVLGDPAVARMMDDRLTSGYSDLIPVGLRKDGGFYGTAAVLGPDEFTALLHRVRELVAAAGGQIADGVVDIAPFRQRPKDACQYCPFHPVCRFDPLLERDACRRETKVADGEILARLRQIGVSGGGTETRA